MFRLTKALALAAVTASGLLITNLSPAMAATSIVEFRVHNTDSSNSMKLTATPPSAFSGYLPVGTQIHPGGYDPSATAFITQAGALPTGSSPVTNKIVYGDYLTGGSLCTFSVIVSKVSGGYQLSFAVDNTQRCSVPSATPVSATGDFSGSVYELTWHE